MAKRLERNHNRASPPGSLTFNDFGQEVGGTLGLLHAVALHDPAVAVDADVPRAA